MTPEEDNLEILTKILESLLPDAPFPVAALGEAIIKSLESVGYFIKYDENFTQENVRKIVEAYTAQHPTPEPFVPPRPPERLQERG